MQQAPLTYREIGAALGVNPGTALRWHRKGMPLDIEGARAWRAQHAGLRAKPKAKCDDAGSTAGGTFAGWRTRRERAMALQAERDLALQAGTLLRAADVESVLALHLTMARELALGCSSRLAPRLIGIADQRVMAGLIDEEMHRLLVHLAEPAVELKRRREGAP